MPRMPLSVQRLALAGSAAASFFLASCAESPSSPARELNPGTASLSQSPELNDPTGRHLFHTRQWYEINALQNAPGNRPTGGGGGGGTGISYHGGPVLQAGTKVAAVYWANTPIYPGAPATGVGDGANDGSLIGFFLRSLSGSSYFNINSTYYDASNQHILNSVAYTQFLANTSNVPADGATVTDAQMLQMLQTAFNTQGLNYDPNTLYAIFTAGKVNLGGGFGTQYCAYHTHGTVTIGTSKYVVLYAAMPYDAAYPGACTNASTSPNGDVGADAEVNTLAHETEETTTDMMANAWFDVRGYENADKCAWTWGTTYTTSNGGLANMNLGGKDFLVQRNWVNVAPGGCALKY